MYLAVDEWVSLEDVRVALVLVWCFAFLQDVTEWSEEVVIPVIIHKPLGFDEWYFFHAHAHGSTASDTVCVHFFHHCLVVLNVYLVNVAVVVVMAAVTWLALLPPHLYDSAT